jgi:hypothetical protein
MTNLNECRPKDLTDKQKDIHEGSMAADATKVTKPPLKPATRYAWFL